MKLTAYVSSIDVMGFLQLALFSYGLAGLGVLFSRRLVNLFDWRRRTVRMRGASPSAHGRNQ